MFLLSTFLDIVGNICKKKKDYGRLKIVDWLFFDRDFLYQKIFSSKIIEGRVLDNFDASKVVLDVQNCTTDLFFTDVACQLYILIPLHLRYIIRVFTILHEYFKPLPSYLHSYCFSEIMPQE